MDKLSADLTSGWMFKSDQESPINFIQLVCFCVTDIKERKTKKREKSHIAYYYSPVPKFGSGAWRYFSTF